MQTDPGPAPISQALVHGFRVLQAFTASEPALTLGQIADRTGLDIGTVFHLVQILVMLGYVERISGSKSFDSPLSRSNWGTTQLCRTQNRFASRRGLTAARRI